MLLSVASCQKEPAQPAFEGFEVDDTHIEAEARGGKHSIVIHSEGEWTVQTKAPWVMVSPANGRGKTECTILVDSTLTYDKRSTEICFMSAGNVLNKLEVTQQGFEPNIEPLSSDVQIEAYKRRDDRWVEVEISTNVEFTATTEDDWISIGDHTLTLDRGARPRSTRLRLDWKMNSAPLTRQATITLQPDSIGEFRKIVIRQAAGPLIEDNRAGDSLAVVTIYNKMECWADNVISDKLPMSRWEALRLWDADDESLPSPEAIGRVRDLDLSYFNTEEGIPQEIRYLKYLETLSLFGNVNTMLKSIDMGEEICDLEYLKGLRVAAYGLVSLPKNFARLGDTLETLDLNSNNFNSLPEVLTAENFPKLKVLNIASNRRASISDLRNRTTASQEGIGLYANTAKDNTIRQLLLWESLEELTLSYNYIEGTIPDFKVGEDGVRAYTMEDIAPRGDTLLWAVENNLPRILPNVNVLRMNLNFFTGDIPDWLLYHPRLLEWAPEVLVYSQQERGIDSEGVNVGFTNTPTSTEPYFERYPLMRGRFEFNDEMTE